MISDDEKKKYFTFLDELRESNKINMFGAPSVLRETFGINKQNARDIFLEWTENFTASLQRVGPEE